MTQPQFRQAPRGERFVRVLPGQYYDAETGKHYNYFRDYDPSIGRYAESDPIGLRGSMSTFGYVGGSPITNRDQLGLCQTTIITMDQWEAAGEGTEILFSQDLTLPVWGWEVSAGPGLGEARKTGKAGIEPDLCSVVKGYHHVHIEMYQNYTVEKKIRYEKVCSTCSCGAAGGGCTDWKDLGLVGARENRALPLVRSEDFFNPVGEHPCVKFPFPSREPF